MEVLPELEPPFKTITGFTCSTIAGHSQEAQLSMGEARPRVGRIKPSR